MSKRKEQQKAKKGFEDRVTFSGGIKVTPPPIEKKKKNENKNKR